VREVGGLHPLEYLAIEAHGFTFIGCNEPHAELDATLWILMCELQHGLCGDELDAELFSELTTERLKLALAVIDLATRKLPAPGHVRTGRALGDQHAPGGIEKTAGDHANSTQR